MVEECMIRCTTCHSVKSEDNFHIRSSNGLRRKTCKECKRKKDAQYRQDNADILKEKRDINKPKRKEYNIKNKESIQEKQRAYDLAHKDERKAYFKMYRSSEKGRASKVNSEHKRRTIKKDGDVSLQDTIMIRKCISCYWCGTQLSLGKVVIDHYYPLAGGGMHTISNIVASCQHCNSSKSAKNPIDFCRQNIKVFNRHL